MLVGDVVGFQFLVEEVDFLDGMLFWLPAVDLFELGEFVINDRAGVDGYTSLNLYSRSRVFFGISIVFAGAGSWFRVTD